MKKLLYGMMAIFAILVVSCKDDEAEEAPVSDAPGIAVPTGTTVKVEEVVSMDFAVTAPGKIGEITVATSEGEAVVLEAASFVGQTSATVTVSYTAPASEGTKTVTLSVKDQQINPKSTSAEAAVEATALAAPVITVPTDTTQVLVGEEVEIEYAITAEGIIAEVTVEASEGEATVEVGDVIGKTSGTVTVTYAAPLSAGVECAGLS